MAQFPDERENIVEVFLEHNSHTLSGERIAAIEISVVIAVICFQTHRPATVEQIFYIKVADKGIVVERLIAITKVAVEHKPVIKQAA